MASEVVSIALETVRDLLIEEAKFISGVSDQVKEVEAELIRMQCFLKDADRRQHKDDTVRNFVKEIRHLVCRIENVLETYAIEVQSRREGHGFQNATKRFVCIFSEGKALHKIGSDIANIKTKLESLTTSLQTYGIREITTGEGGQSSSAAILDQNQQRLRHTYAHQVEEYFVGMKDDVRQLVSLITDEETRSHRVISIYGMGGLGKTTLTRKIYNHVEVQRCFELFAWVSITQQFSTRNVFGDILKQLLPNKKESIKNMEERELVNELYKVQKELKCLVVLDDLLEIDDWRSLSPAFPFAEANSKILITTRNQNLAEVEFAYPLSFLSEDEGLELLQKKAFPKRDSKDTKIDSKLENIGRELVLKCGKLPLAISALGGILSQKSSLYEWEVVNKDVDSYLRMSESSKDGYGGVLQVLALSYDELPYHLKPCFLHLGNFREDENIDVEMLYQMWTAEGMVLSEHGGMGVTLTDIAEQYLLEMANKSMVEVKFDELSTSRRVKSCRLHDLMRDFCLTRGKEVDFLKIMNFGRGMHPLSNPFIDQLRPSRYSIYMEYDGANQINDNDAITNTALGAANGQLRSLLVSAGSWNTCISFPRVIYDSQKFKFLRVLKFERYEFKGKRLPRGIKKLIHLRFLSVKDCILDKLPSSIGALQYLHTLDIRVDNYIEVPNVLWKLERLRHLYLPITRKTQKRKGKLHLFGLSQLETLVEFCNKDDEIGDLSQMINLRFLDATIYVRENDSIVEVLNYLNSDQHKLRETRLSVVFCSIPEAETTERIVPLKDFFACCNLHYLRISWGRCEFQKLEVEEPLHFCSNLIELTLRQCAIEGDPMNFLGKLSNLRSLDLDQVDLVDKKVMICDANSFPKLIYLKIDFLRKLEKWMVDEGAMPNLSRLALEYCLELDMIPDGLRFIPTLKELSIISSKEFNQRVQGVDGREGVDYGKIRHIPLITVALPVWERGRS